MRQCARRRGLAGFPALALIHAKTLGLPCARAARCRVPGIGRVNTPRAPVAAEAISFHIGCTRRGQNRRVAELRPHRLMQVKADATATAEPARIASRSQAMPWKTLTTFVTDMAQDAAALAAASGLARRHDAHLEVFCLGIDLTQPEVYYTGAQAVVLPGTMEEADHRAKDLEAAVRKKLGGEDLRWSVAAVATPIVGVSATVSDAARFSDLVVATQPYGPGRGTPQVQVVESALFGADARVLVVPNASLPAAFDRVVLAWNDSPEAMRAMRAALPVLQEARETEIVIVDPPRHGPDRSDPGGRLAQVLARHGVAASIRILARTMPTVSNTLSRHVEDSGADLLVMGAYGHSRLRESILGGATRDMLEHARVPVLMVH